MILVGSFGESGDQMLPKGFKTFLMIVALVAVVIAVLIITDFWSTLYNIFFVGTDSPIFANAIFFAIIIGAIAAVIWGAGKPASASG